MNREEAICYLKSSGMSDEQIKSVIDAFTCEDCISREDVINAIKSEDELSFMGAFCSHDCAMGFIETIKELPSVTPSIPDVENNYNIGYNCGYADAMIDIAESEE